MRLVSLRTGGFCRRPEKAASGDSKLMSGDEGSLRMRSRTSMLLLSGAIGLLTTGCAAISPTMRAQSPDATQVSYGGGGHGATSANQCATCDSGYTSAGMPANCDNGACQSCGPGRAPCVNLPCHPVHRNFHTYDAPRGLSYPQNDTPAAVYQYPYYTTRGPTDFFMK